MNDDTKRDRRDRIAHVAQAKAQGGRTAYSTYWATRNRINGVLANEVQIWLREPQPIRSTANPGDVYWYAGEASLWSTWSLEECAKNMRTYPDDERQCLRREGWGGVHVPT